MSLNPVSTPTLSRDAKLVLAAAGIFSLGFMGISVLLKVLYVLRLGAGPEYIGFFNASSAIAYAAMSLPAGILGARYGERRVMRSGGYIMVAGLAIMPFASLATGDVRLALPFVSQVITTFGWSMFNVNIVPALMGYVSPRNRNDAFAWNAALRGSGTLVGMLFGGLLPAMFASQRGLGPEAHLPYALALAVGTLITAAGFIPMAMVKPVSGHEGSRVKTVRVTPFPWLPVIVLLVHVFLSHGGWAMSQSFFNAYADQELRISAGQLGVLSAIGQGLAVAVTFLNPKLARRFSNGWMLIVTTLGIALSQLLLAFMPHWSAAGLARWGILAFSTMWMPSLQVFQMELVAPEWRSLVFGAMNMVMASSFATASLVGGYYSSAQGSYRPVFMLGAVLCSLGVLGAVVLMRRYESKAEATV